MEDNNSNYNQHLASVDNEKGLKAHYVKLLTYAIIAILCYYIGAFLLIFVRNIDGVLSTSISTNEVSVRLAFENFPEFVRNLFENLFGYFNEYSKLYNRDTKFLIPLDIGIKLLVIGYFVFFWMPWDTIRNFKRGFFAHNYPYVDEDIRKEYAPKIKKVEPLENKNIESEIVVGKIPSPTDTNPSYLPNNTNLPEYYKSNPYLRVQLLQAKVATSQPVPVITTPAEQVFDEDEEEEEDGLMPFDGIHKPLEEIYQKYEKMIYTVIRKQILPGSNILLVAYFSTLFIVDIANPLSIMGYVLGVMSMFWCMQSFLMILDHNQFSPDFHNR